jgi:hypothetical protein
MPITSWRSCWPAALSRRARLASPTPEGGGTAGRSISAQGLMRLGCTGGHYGATVHCDRGLEGSPGAAFPAIAIIVCEKRAIDAFSAYDHGNDGPGGGRRDEMSGLTWPGGHARPGQAGAAAVPTKTHRSDTCGDRRRLTAEALALRPLPVVLVQRKIPPGSGAEGLARVVRGRDQHALADVVRHAE